MIRGAIFDIDGTLLDSMPAWTNMGNSYLKRLNINPENNLAVKLFALSLSDGAQYLIDNYNLNKTKEQVIRELVTPVYKFYADEVEFKPGAGEFLNKLKEAAVPMSVATAGDAVYLEAPFKRLKIEDCFKCVLTCTQFNTNKNDPLIFIKAAELMGCAVEETYVFEDSYPAAETAKNAGFKVVGVYDKTYDFMKERLRSVSDFFIDDYRQLNIENM